MKLKYTKQILTFKVDMSSNCLDHLVIKFHKTLKKTKIEIQKFGDKLSEIRI